MIQLYIFIGAFIASLGVAHSATDGESTFPNPRKLISSAEKKPHLGLRLGNADPQHGYDGSLEYGVEVGYQPYIPYSVGLEFSAFASERTGQADLERLKLLVKGSYNFGGTLTILKDSYVGAGIGPVLDTYANTSYGRLGVSLNTGFDIPLSRTKPFMPNSYSLGFDANYLFVSDAAPDTFGLTGIAKYWF